MFESSKKKRNENRSISNSSFELQGDAKDEEKDGPNENCGFAAGGVPSGVVPGQQNVIPKPDENLDIEKVNTPSMSMLADFVMSNFRINVDYRKEKGSNGLSVEDRLRDNIMAATCS